MFALLKIARIYKALKLFVDLQGPICYKDSKNKKKTKSSNVLKFSFTKTLSLGL